MERCDKSLFDIYKNNEINDKFRIRFAHDMIKGIAFIHSKNICHRDIKLENIFIKDEKIKIGDFGCSKKTVDE